MPTEITTEICAQRSATSLRIWWPATTMLLCSLLSYLDRQTLAILSPMMLADLKWSAETYSEVISAFSIAYMLGNPIWGAAIDRIGVRRGMTLSVSIWTIASGAHAMLSGFFGFAAARAVLGFGEGATFPGGLRTATDSLPPEKQSRGFALAFSGGSLGALLTPLLVTPIAVAYGWRSAFLVTALAGFLWIIVWRWTVDFSVLESGRRTKRITLPNVLERRFWSLVVSYSLGALALGPILYLAPLYLSRVLGFSQTQIGHVLWIPPLGWEVGYFFWGWFTDRTAARNPRPTWLLFLLAVLGVPLVVVTAFLNPAIVLGLMFWAMFIAAGFVVVTLRVGAFAYPREQTSLVAGIGAGAWSAVVAIILPVLGGMFDAKHYATAFVIVGLGPLVGVILWWFLTFQDRNANPANDASAA